jgi:PIN domain nuclease of toxin-antitoxin system
VIVLDTQAWLRLAGEPDRLTRAASSAIRRAARSDGLAISLVSVWEACWLRRRGKLRAAHPMRAWIANLRTETQVAVVPLTDEICIVAGELPEPLPTDPCDRLIVATALVLGRPLVTADERIRASGAVATIW